MEDVPEASSSQYLAQFKLIETKQDGKQDVLSAPKILVIAGQMANIMIGEVSPDGKKGDRIEIEFTVNELLVGDHKK